jgi:hypothetical protein
MKTLEIRWPTVALVAAVVAGIVAVFAFAGPDERSDLLGILAVLGTTAAAVMRAAFGAEPVKSPKRIETNPRVNPRGAHRCAKCDRIPGPEGESHAPDCPWLGTQQMYDEDDDDPGAGGEVLADGPPTVPQRHSSARHTMLTVIGGLTLSTLSACSPSALRTHATIALVASHTLEVTRASALAACAALRDTCAADAVCIERTRTDCLAVADAQDATVAAVATYIDGIELAALADEGRVMEALRFTLEAAERVWVSFGERLATIGIALPSLGGGL